LFCALWTCAIANAGPGPGQGSIELRIQTSSSVVGGGIIGTILPTGITYETRDKEWLLNLGAGAAYFVAPQFAVGGDVSFTLISNSETISIFTLAPFAKYVTGLAEHQIGGFVEPSVGFSFLHESVSFGSGNNTLFQVEAWAGASFPVGAMAALQVGPYVAYLRNLSNDSDTFLIGARFGLSVYLFQ